MESGMSIYILPAGIALAIKLMVLFVVHNRIGQSSIFIAMVLVFAGHNLAEVLGFLEYFNGDRFDHVLRWYYVMTAWSISLMLLYSLEVSQSSHMSKLSTIAVLGGAATISLVILFSDFIVAGAASLGYIMTAEKGEMYGLFLGYVVLSSVIIGVVLFNGYRFSKKHLTEIQCSYTLLALSPILISGVAIILLMKIGYEINAAAIFPFMTTLFLLITLRSESKHGLTDIRRHIPFSLERRKASEIMDIFSSYAKDQANYRDSMVELERLMVTYKHDKNAGNVSATAATMGIPRSSLYSIFRRLNIEHKDSKS